MDVEVEPIPPTIEVLARGESWVAVAKPSGLAVHRSRMVRDRVTLLDCVRDQLGMDANPVHRLDRPASGVMLFSLDRDWTRYAQAAWPEAHKRYLVFVRGAIATRTWCDVTRPIKDDNGILKEAHTRFRCLASAGEPTRSSLVLAEPKTGRYHQIRRHIRGLSHPVLGDSMHGDTRINRFWREEHGLPRLGLHAFTLQLEVLREPIRVCAPIPSDLLALWTTLPWWREAQSALEELAA